MKSEGYSIPYCKVVTSDVLNINYKEKRRIFVNDVYDVFYICVYELYGSIIFIHALLKVVSFKQNIFSENEKD